MLQLQHKAQVIFCTGGKYRARNWSREQAVSGLGKWRDVGSSFQVPCKQTRGEGSGSPMVERWVPAGCRSHWWVASDKSVSCGRRGLKSTMLLSDLHPQLCSGSGKSPTALAGESWLFSISWVLLSPQSSPTAASPSCRQPAGYEQTFTSACSGIGHFCVCLSGLDVCVHKLHLQFWYRLLREDFTPGRNCTSENQ